MKILERSGYQKLAAPLSQLPINHLFARSVIENKISGKIYVDDPGNPTTFYIVHPYGMSLLFGECTNKVFNEAFREHALNTHNTREKNEWMQAFPASWDRVLAELFNGKLINHAGNAGRNEKGVIELNTRVNFKFNLERYRAYTQNHYPQEIIRRTDKQSFNQMKGSVIPSLFWKSDDDFLQNGIGFSLFYQNELASTAYSSFVHDNQLELGIETIEEFRGKGFAARVCSALIDYCIQHGLEPVWSCRLENTGSYRLAQKLGFIPTVEIAYYRLSI